VRGYNVPIGSQPYALAVAGPLGGETTLTLTKRATPSQEAVPGGLITYALALSADQPLAKSITLTDTLPLHTSFVSASDGGTLSGSVITWTIPSLAADTTVTRTLVARVTVVSAASDGTHPSAGGPPVSVGLKSAAAPSERKVYVSLVLR
jgi:uncharacterized repeat protein (TIGR01451 family)